jgi:hypothetical protein
MNRRLTPLALKDYIAVRAAFDKQVKLLVENLHHPSLRARSTTWPGIFGRRA